MNTSQAPDPFRRRKARFNSLKFRTLEAFEKHGWIDPPTLAALTGLYPARSAYTYALRLYRFGLLERGKDDRGFLLYSLTGKGRERLAWIKRTRENRRKEEGK